MSEENYTKSVQFSSICFLRCKDHFLFNKRGLHKRVDPGKINGVGGRLEKEENFVEAAIREVEEETGIVVKEKDMKLAGVIHLNGSFDPEHIVNLFIIKVDSMEIPKQDTSDDGEMIWIHKDDVFDAKYDMVDDIKRYFKDIMNGENIVFARFTYDDDNKICDLSMTVLKS